MFFIFSTFYDEDEEQYIMDEGMIHPGLACCIKFNNKQWHRGTILKVIEDSQTVKVLVSFCVFPFKIEWNLISWYYLVHSISNQQIKKQFFFFFKMDEIAYLYPTYKIHLAKNTV